MSEDVGWSLSKNIGVGAVISVVFYCIWIVSWVNGLSHRIDAVDEKVEGSRERITEHRVKAAHQRTLPVLADHGARIKALEEWRRRGSGGR